MEHAAQNTQTKTHFPFFSVPLSLSLLHLYVYLSLYHTLSLCVSIAFFSLFVTHSLDDSHSPNVLQPCENESLNSTLM